MRTCPARPAPTPSGSWAARYIEFDIDRDEIARYGLTIGDVQDVLAVALGGMPIATTVEGLERYDINLRYDRDFRSNLDALRNDIVIPTPTGAQVPLGQLADLQRRPCARWASRARPPCRTPGCTWTCAAWTSAPTSRMPCAS